MSTTLSSRPIFHAGFESDYVGLTLLTTGRTSKIKSVCTLSITLPLRMSPPDTLIVQEPTKAWSKVWYQSFGEQDAYEMKVGTFVSKPSSTSSALQSPSSQLQGNCSTMKKTTPELPPMKYVRFSTGKILKKSGLQVQYVIENGSQVGTEFR